MLISQRNKNYTQCKENLYWFLDSLSDNIMMMVDTTTIIIKYIMPTREKSKISLNQFIKNIIKMRRSFFCINKRTKSTIKKKV